MSGPATSPLAALARWLRLFAVMPLTLWRTLAHSAVLLDGRLREYNRYTPDNCLNSLFYWRFADELLRRGRSGVSPHIAGGGFSLGRLWYVTLPSLYAYRWFAAAVAPAGMAAWLAGHLLWLDAPGAPWWWVAGLLAAVALSPAFFHQAFVAQNYNALGWLFLPVGLFAWHAGLWWLATLAWLGASFCSITCACSAGLLSVPLALAWGTPLPVLTLVPAGLKTLTHLVPLLRGGNAEGGISDIAKQIGLLRGGIYRRGGRRLPTAAWWNLACGLALACALALSTGRLPVLLATALALLAVNQLLLRFADLQSMLLLVLSCALASALAAGPDAWTAPALVLLAWPPPGLLGVPTAAHACDPPALAPFPVRRVLDPLEELFAAVPEGSRVFMAYADPSGVYEHIFLGYRTIHEAGLYAAQCRGVTLLPDWPLVSALNRPGAPSPWGREPKRVLENMRRWDAGYLLWHEPVDGPADHDPAAAGFRELARFSWKDLEHLWEVKRPYSGPTPLWRLFEPPPGA